MSARMIYKGLRRVKTSNDLLTAFLYFVRNVSVGELIVEEELRDLGVKSPHQAITRLIDLGLLEHGLGCYNLPPAVRNELRDLAAIEGVDILTEARKLGVKLSWWLR